MNELIGWTNTNRKPQQTPTADNNDKKTQNKNNQG